MLYKCSIFDPLLQDNVYCCCEKRGIYHNNISVILHWIQLISNWLLPESDEHPRSRCNGHLKKWRELALLLDFLYSIMPPWNPPLSCHSPLPRQPHHAVLPVCVNWYIVQSLTFITDTTSSVRSFLIFSSGLFCLSASRPLALGVNAFVLWHFILHWLWYMWYCQDPFMQPTLHLEILVCMSCI